MSSNASFRHTLQAPLILGNDISAMGNVTLAILSNPHAIGVNQVRDAIPRQDALSATASCEATTLCRTPWVSRVAVLLCSSPRTTRSLSSSTTTLPLQVRRLRRMMVVKVSTDHVAAVPALECSPVRRFSPHTVVDVDESDWRRPIEDVRDDL